MRYISNPRRAPRVPARLRVEVLHRGVDFRAETADVGPKGCLVVSPRPLDPGAWVRLMLEADRLPEKLRVTGRVAWASQPGRERAGVAFAEMQVERNQDPFAWFDRLVRASPGLVPVARHVPDRLPLDTPLYLLPPPRFIVDFTRAELGLIAWMRNGTTVEQLLQRLEPERKNEGRLIFALLGRRVLSLSAREACHPEAWRPVLREAGVLSNLEVDDEPEEMVRLADYAVEPEPEEKRRLAGPAVEPDPASLRPAADRDILPSWLTQSRPGWSERPGAQVLVPPPPPELPAVARPAARGAATGAGPSRPVGDAPAPGSPSSRSPQAQQHYDHALASAARGDIQGALRLLRQALALSPRDPEIARALGQLAFRDRKVPEH